MVRTTKEALRKMVHGSWKQRLANFLFLQRVSPCATIGKSPAELLMKCRLRFSTASTLTSKKKPLKVIATNYAHGPKWCPATTVAPTGPVSYKVRTIDGQLWKRHLDQLRKRHPSIEITEDIETDVNKTQKSNIADNPSQSEQEDCQQLMEKSPSAVVEPITEPITETIAEQPTRPPRTRRKPKNTTQPTRPFENTGLDVASPLLTRSGKTVKKSYPHIYQHDHTSSTPGSCIRHDSSQSDESDTSIYSPTWQTLNPAQLDQELQLLLDTKMTDCLEKELSAHRIQWNTAKGSSRRGRTSTIRCDIEARTNARPLTYLSEDPKDPEVLTPYHFLPGTKFMDLPEVNPEDEEWVPKLQLLHSSENNEASKVRDIVSIEECNVPRNKWKLGRIIAVYPGKDGIARTAK
ncbi:hypothetical protein T08_4957 [Trichinella sp. T8]|nr:hypothetical protein T08_4957 [Trichinella sp. T8]